MGIIWMFIGLTLLVVGGEFLVRSAVALSFKLNISKMVIGLTVVSFATSAPELLVSLNAALNGFSDISLTNVIGSNSANIGLVLGITAIISSLAIDRDFLRFNWPVMLLFSIGLYVCLQNDGVLSRLEGVLLLIALALYLALLIKKSKSAPTDHEDINEELSGISNIKITLWLGIGATALYYGSEWLVDGAVDIATFLGVSDRVIGVTMIAMGTSVPELAASVIAALKKERALSLGNLIGSNIFNIGSVLGITAIIHPISMTSQAILSNDILWMLGFAGVLFPLIFLPKPFVLSRYKGAILFVGYAAFIALAFISE